MHHGVPQGSVIGLHLFLLFVDDLPDVLEADNADDDTLVPRRTQRMNLHNSLIAAWDSSHKLDLLICPTKCNYLIIGREAPLRLSFFPDGYGTPVPVSILVKDQGIQTDNMFFSSAQCTETTNKA